jgi:hypothetical protein
VYNSVANDVVRFEEWETGRLSDHS